MPRQLAEIVILPPRADHGMAIAEHREIAFAVERKSNCLQTCCLSSTSSTPGKVRANAIIAATSRRLAQMHPDE